MPLHRHARALLRVPASVSSEDILLLLVGVALVVAGLIAVFGGGEEVVILK